LAACRERLEQTVYAVDPLLILAVGKISVQALLGKSVRITHDRGQIFDIEIPGVTGGIRYPLLVTYHPAYVARTGDFTSRTGPGQLFASDLQKAFNLLDEIRHLTRNEPKPPRRKWK
jgi:uracil-DNA glycosylase family 4